MKMRLLFLGFAMEVCLSLALYGRAFEVQPIGKKEAGVWGTDEFQVTLSPAGTLRHVKVHGKEIIFQAAALYTSPIPPDGKEGIRKVQGEGHDTRGLGMKPPTMRTRVEDEKRIFEFDHLIATSRILDGRPLCKVAQKIVIAPTGEIDVLYEFEWLETLRWNNFGHLIIFNEENCRDREYIARVQEQFYAGKLEKGPDTSCRIRDVAFNQLTLRTDVGPVHFIWLEESRCSFHWGTGLQLHISPKTYQSGTIYKGQKDRIAYRILLPVLQQ